MLSLLALIGIAGYCAICAFRGFPYEHDPDALPYEAVRALFAVTMVVAAVSACYRAWELWEGA